MSEYVFEIKESAFYDGYEYSVPCEKKEEIVRCRDCRLVFDQEGHKCCFHNHNDNGESYLINPDGFCSWGEKE